MSKSQYCAQLFEAIRKKDLESVKFCLQNGVDINTKNKIGSSLLHEAAFRENLEIVKTLIQNGANINAKDRMVRLLCTMLLVMEFTLTDIADVLKLSKS